MAACPHSHRRGVVRLRALECRPGGGGSNHSHGRAGKTTAFRLINGILAPLRQASNLVISPTLWRLVQVTVQHYYGNHAEATVTSTFGFIWPPLMLLLAWYLIARQHPRLGLDRGRQPIRLAAILFGCSIIAAYISANRSLLPAAQQVIPVISFIALHKQELVTAMANLGADLEARTSANTPTGSASYLRSMSGLGRESVFGQSIREPTNRNNTYFAPGELANIASGGLLSASCANINNVSQVPLLFGNVPCRLQPQFPWGPGIGTSYYPRVKAAKP